jgi:AraC-like DNA-binding protein
MRAEGTSYQQIKDGIRRDMSIELLADTRRSVADIAGQVGFNDASSFSRAFKEWTGVPPAAYRSGTQESGGQGYVSDA